MIKTNNIITIIFANMVVFCYVQAMEKSALNDILLAVQELDVQVQHDICMEGFNNFYDENHPVMISYKIKAAQEVENAGDSMNSIEKLKRLIGDDYFEKRKNIIKFMIEHEKVHPNNIRYQFYYPLCEGVIQNDSDFVTYLLNHGARLKSKDLNLIWSSYKYGKVQKNDVLRQLFLQHSIMFYKKNNKGDILPVWHHNDPLQNVTKSLSHLIDSIKPKKKEIHFIMNVPHEKKEVLNEIKKIGFNVHFSDDKMTQLIYKKAEFSDSSDSKEVVD